MRLTTKLPMRMGCICPRSLAGSTGLDCSAAPPAMPSAIGARNRCPAVAGPIGSRGLPPAWDAMMRAILVVGFCAFLCPAAVLAQTAVAPGAAPTRGGDIARDQYIEHAVERARHAAEARFDRMD